MSRKITRSKTQTAINSFENLQQQFPQIHSQLMKKLDEKLSISFPINNMEAVEIQAYTKPLKESLEKYRKTFASFMRAVKDMPEPDEDTLAFKNTVSETISKINQIQEDLEFWRDQAAEKIMIHNMTLGYFVNDPVSQEPATQAESEEETPSSNE